MSDLKKIPLINIGGTSIILKDEVLGVFDLDTASTGKDTKRFLSAGEKNGRVKLVGNDIPKSFVVVVNGRKELIYMTQLSVSSVEGRWRRQSKHL